MYAKNTLDAEVVPFDRAAIPRDWDRIRECLALPLEFPSGLEVQLARHAETVTNAQRIVTGGQDVDLSPLGLWQARQLGPSLTSVYDAAFCSHLRRSRDTLRIALMDSQAEVGRIYSDPRLGERRAGEMELRPYQPASVHFQRDFCWAPPGGESYLDVTLRVLDFLLDLVEHSKRVRVRRILILSHKTTLRVLWGILDRELDPRRVLDRNLGNAELVSLQVESLHFPGFLEHWH